MRERELPSAFRGLEPLAEPTVLGRVDVSPNPDHPAPAPAPSPVRTQIPRRSPKSSNPPPPTLGRIVLLRGQPLSSAQVLAMARAAGDFRWTLKSYPPFLSSPGRPLHSPRTIRISTAGEGGGAWERPLLRASVVLDSDVARVWLAPRHGCRRLGFTSPQHASAQHARARCAPSHH